MTTGSRRDALRILGGALVLTAAGAGAAWSQSGGAPAITVYKSPT